jgi:hypothetical protein
MLKKIRTLYSYVLKTTFNNVYFGKVLNESRFSFQDWVTDSETFKMTGFNPLSDLPSAEEAGEFVRVNKLKWLRSHNESSIDKRLRLRHYTVTKSLTLSGWLKSQQEQRQHYPAVLPAPEITIPSQPSRMAEFDSGSQPTYGYLSPWNKKAK